MPRGGAPPAYFASSGSQRNLKLEEKWIAATPHNEPVRDERVHVRSALLTSSLSALRRLRVQRRMASELWPWTELTCFDLRLVACGEGEGPLVDRHHVGLAGGVMIGRWAETRCCRLSVSVFSAYAHPVTLLCPLCHPGPVAWNRTKLSTYSQAPSPHVPHDRSLTDAHHSVSLLGIVAGNSQCKINKALPLPGQAYLYTRLLLLLSDSSCTKENAPALRPKPKVGQRRMRPRSHGVCDLLISAIFHEFDCLVSRQHQRSQATILQRWEH